MACKPQNKRPPLKACTCCPARRADSALPGSRYWYVDSYGLDAGSSRYAYNGSAFGGAPTYVLRYALPAGLACERCVLQWAYLTGNSCTPPCEPADPNYAPSNPAKGCDKQAMGICGQSGNYPEVRAAACTHCRVRACVHVRECVA